MTDLQDFLDGASVSQEVFVLRPDYRAALLAVDGISSTQTSVNPDSLLCEAEAATKARLAQCNVVELPHIAAWRETYRAFGTNPSKVRNSLEALTRRADSGLPRVNQLTDLYNALSVKYQIPFGGEDLAKYHGSPALRRATGSESFETKVSGETQVEHPKPGEVVWCDDDGVTCRHWNWRQTPRTALTPDTSKVLFILDALAPCDDKILDDAIEELLTALRQFSPNIRHARRLIRA